MGEPVRQSVLACQLIGSMRGKVKGTVETCSEGNTHVRDYRNHLSAGRIYSAFRTRCRDLAAPGSDARQAAFRAVRVC